jgi:hypothetical protein
LETAAVDEIPAKDFSSSRFENKMVGLADASGHPRSCLNSASRSLNDLGVFLGDLNIVHDPRNRHPEPFNAGGMGFIIAQFLLLDALHSLDPVGIAPSFQFIQSGDFFLAGGHHDLTAPLMGNLMFFAKAVHGISSL